MEQDAFLTSELLDEGEPDSQESTPGRGAVDLHNADGKYEYFTKKEPAWKQTDIQVDEQGRRYQIWSIGMVRNAKPENRKDERVYLDPSPHILKSTNIPIRGWYKSKYEPSGVRARPCMTDAILTSPYAGTCTVGCPFCVAPDSLIETMEGLKRIVDVEVGEYVLGRDWDGPVFGRVLGKALTYHNCYLKVTLGGNVLELSENHNVCVEGKWKPAGQLRAGDRIEKLPYLWEKTSAWRAGRGEQRGLLLPKVCRRLRQERSAVCSLWEYDTAHFRGQHTKALQETGVCALRSWGAFTGDEETGGLEEIYVGGNDQAASQFGIQGGYVEEGAGAHSWTVQEDSLPEDGWAGDHCEGWLGFGAVSMVGPEGMGLGIRARHLDVGGRGVSPGLPHPNRRPNFLHRGQRAERFRGLSTDAEICDGLRHRGLGRQEDACGRGFDEERQKGVFSDVVQSVEKVNRRTLLVDIQTETENFYCAGRKSLQGLLLHNCYVENGTRGYRGAGVTVVDVEYPDKVRQQVRGMKTATAFYMSSFIDPFMDLEDIYHNTKRTAKVALDNGLPMFFLTRKVAPVWVFDYLKQNKYSYMQFSLNTPDPEDWKRLSPKAAPLETQFDQVAEFHKQGIYVSIQVNPIIAGVTSNEQIIELIHILARRGADHLIFKFVELVSPSRGALIQQMHNRFGRDKDHNRAKYDYDRGARFEELFAEVIGGMYTIKEDYRKAALDLYSEECKKAGVTMSLCYEYEYERDKDGKILNKTGVSMGMKYLTADQCHGHRVPVYTRNGPGGPWQEIKGCPPSGCLSCQEQFPKETPCHNDLLASAPAWTPAMMRQSALLPKGSQKGRITLPLYEEHPAGVGCSSR